MKEIHQGTFQPLRAPSLPLEAAILHVEEHEPSRYTASFYHPALAMAQGFRGSKSPVPSQTKLGRRTSGLIPVQTALPLTRRVQEPQRGHTARVEVNAGRAGPLLSIADHRSENLSQR